MGKVIKQGVYIIHECVLYIANYGILNEEEIKSKILNVFFPLSVYRWQFLLYIDNTNHRGRVEQTKKRRKKWIPNSIIEFFLLNKIISKNKSCQISGRNNRLSPLTSPPTVEQDEEDEGIRSFNDVWWLESGQF